MSEIIQKIYQQNLGFEYIWIDAGWYGDSTQPCLNEFEGDWPNHTGDWSVNPTYHPDGFRDVSRAVLDCGMKFMLWLEPERCNEKSRIALAHPEWFLKRKEKSGGKRLLAFEFRKQRGSGLCCGTSFRICKGAVSFLLSSGF